MKRAKGQHGFTLVEVVMATMVTLLVAGATVAILRSTAAARQRVYRQMALQQRSRAALGVIVVALRNGFRSGGDQAVLEGLDDWREEAPADRIRFFTISRNAVRMGYPESDVKECEFFLSEAEDDRPPALMRRLDPTLNERPDGGGVVEMVAQSVAALDFTYHDGAEWLDEWSIDRKGWPMAIRIRVAVLNEAGPSAPWLATRLVNFPHRPAYQEQDSNE